MKQQHQRGEPFHFRRLIVLMPELSQFNSALREGPRRIPPEDIGAPAYDTHRGRRANETSYLVHVVFFVSKIQRFVST